MSGALANMKQRCRRCADGSVMRGTRETVGKHLRALQVTARRSEVYRALSAAAVEIAADEVLMKKTSRGQRLLRSGVRCRNKAASDQLRRRQLPALALWMLVRGTELRIRV